MKWKKLFVDKGIYSSSLTSKLRNYYTTERETYTVKTDDFHINETAVFGKIIFQKSDFREWRFSFLKGEIFKIGKVLKPSADPSESEMRFGVAPKCH